MRKFILAFGIIGILAVFSVQGWAAETALYGCAQGKSGEVRAVNAPGDCLPSETVVALNKSDAEGTASQKAPESVGLREKLRNFDYRVFGLPTDSGGFHR